jgi:hypothetical protein
MHSEYKAMPSLWYFCTIPSKFSLFVCVFVFFGGGWGGRFVENIPRHITPRSGFESFAEYTQCLQEGTVRLAAMADIRAGEEIYVRHAPGDIQWSCFHPDGCKSGAVFVQYTSQHRSSHV